MTIAAGETSPANVLTANEAVTGRVLSVGFMLVERFSMIAFSSAIEPLRLANRAVGRDLYRFSLWSVYSRARSGPTGSPDLDQ